jgi:hypothetical protein
MALVYTSDDLVAEIRNLGMLPNTGSMGFEDEDILAHASAVLQSKIVPEIMRVREEYFVATTRIDLTDNQSYYRIPSRAIGNKLRDLFWIDSDGYRQRIDPILREELDDWNSTGVEDPQKFYLEGNYVVLVPNLTTSPNGSLEVAFYFRPGDLVPTSSARTITNVAGSVVTCDSDVPASWTTANTFDIHSYQSGGDIKCWDLTASAVGPVGNEEKVTFTSAIDGSVHGTKVPEVGDWLCLAGEAAIPAIPRDFHPVLVRGTAMRIAEAAGDAQQVQIHSQLFQADLSIALSMLETRVEGRPPRIIGRRSVLWSKGW